MKVLTRKDFLALPAGVLFCKGVKWSFEQMCIKQETLYEFDYEEIKPYDFPYFYEEGGLCEFDNEERKPYDFYYLDFSVFQCKRDINDIEVLEDCLKNGSSCPLSCSISRDGMYNDEEVFLVYETEDILVLGNIINRAKGEW